jgi:FkbM family methyltransferase
VTDIIQADGFSWVWGGSDTDDDVGFGNHERYLEPCFRQLLGDGVFLDVGAHVGHWALRMASQASMVLAVEPHPGTADVLRQNIALNGITNITVIEAAAWDERTTLYLDGGEKSHSINGCVMTGQGTAVMAVPIDGLVRQDQCVRLVKMDVEGADLHALRGMRQMLVRCRPDLMIEQHYQTGYYSVSDMYALLAELGYEWQELPDYWLARPAGESLRDVAVIHDDLPTDVTAVTGLPHRTRLVRSGDGGSAGESMFGDSD